MRWTMVLVALAACKGEPDAKTKPTPTDPPVVVGDSGLGYLAIGDVELDLSTGRRFFAIPGSELARTSRITALTGGSGEVVLRWETASGAVLQDPADDRLELAGDQRLVIEVHEDGAIESWMVAITPPDWPPIEAVGTAEDLFFFLAPRDYLAGGELEPSGYGKFIAIVDPAGTPIWWRPVDKGAFDFRTTPTDVLTVNTAFPGQDVQTTNVVDPTDGSILSSWVPTQVPAGWDTVRVDVHEYTLNADGSALRTLTGNGTEDLSFVGGAVDGQVWHSAVQEVDPAGNVTFHWETWGQYDLTTLPPEVIASEADVGAWRYLHINSAEAHDEGILISLRSPNQVRMLSRDTGETLWRVGGSDSDFAFVGDPRGGFYGQHSARMFDPDRLTVFDNGTNFDSPHTGDVRVVEFLLDHDAGTATHQWEYALSGAGASDYEGNVQRLPDGRTVVGWGTIQEQAGDRAPSVSLLGVDHQPVLDFYFPYSMHTYRAYAFTGDPFTGAWNP